MFKRTHTEGGSTMEAQAYLLILVALFGGATSEYTCKSLPAYLFPLGNKNCYKDPDIKSDVSSLLTRHGYKPEKLSTMTEDGYILNTFKVSKGGNGPPVLLVHGAGSNSGVFTALRKNSLAFTLIEGGYTVYLANLRGSRYSKEHKKLTASDQKYWDFSIDDLVDKEVPAILSFVIQDSKSKDGITYIGYDLGSTIFAGYASRNASLAQNQVKKAFLIGNAGKPSLLERILGKRSDLYFKKKKFLHLLRLFSDGKYRCFFAELFKKMGLTKIIFFWIVTRKYGPNGNLDGGILPAFYDTHFDSNPLKVEVQTWQTDKDGSFYRYYSIQGIKDLFGKHIKREPYDLTKIKVPTYTYISEDDKYSPKGQILHEYDQIPKEFRAGKKIITKKGFNNLAYFYGTDAKKLVYDDILQKIAGGGDSSSDESSNESGE